ncbi:ankyrin repeat-containing domain protein [Lentinula raphanica]|nr:ankyrin repeat-containing domain protein [Lentinula raphanica]
MTPDLSSDEEKELQDWLAAPNCSINYSTALNKRALGTGQWILKDPVYLKWREQGGIFWLQGQAGSGKTFLMTSIIQHFKTTITWPTTLMIYHYFDTRDNSGSKTSFQGFLSSLLLQLGAQNEKIHPILQDLHKSSKNGLGHSMPTNTDLEDTLMKITKDLAEKKYQVHVIIDALDECKEEKEVWNFCKTITSLDLVSGVMLSTRSYRPEYSKYSTVSLMNNNKVDNDIDIFLKKKISFDSTDLNTKIQTTLMEKANGGASEKAIHKALAKLPSNLEEIYSEAITKCENSRHSNEAQYILSWVLYAFEPLYMRQVATILSVDLQSKKIDLNAKMLIGLEKIIDTTLVTVDNRDIVHLAHASVKDFLLDSHINSQTSRLLNINAKLAHNIIGQMCLICLLSEREYKPIWGNVHWVERENIVTFEQYATEYWAKHSQYNERGECPYEELTQLSQEFLNNELGMFKNWKENFWEFHNNNYTIRNKFIFVKCSNLQVAAFFGMKICIQQILIDIHRLDSDINAQEGYYGSAIQAAAAEGYKDIVECLLQHGADINLQGGHYGTAIAAAAFGGHQDVVEYLVQHGADINLQGGYFGTAIVAAAVRGHQHVVEYLVQHGADINLQGGNHPTAIAAAAFWGHQDVVEYLVEHGADINSQGGNVGTVIVTAAYRGHQGIVKYLVQHGADISLQGDYGTAIVAAALCGHQDIVDYLFQHGANANLQGGYYGTAIAAAASKGHQDIVEYLVQHCADINLHSGEYGTAIAAAAVKGYQGIVEYLVQHGADVNLQGGDFGTAIAAAAYEGHQDVVEYLVQHGADINFQGGHYETAIAEAASGGHQDIVEYLVQHGADINLQGSHYGTAIAAAASEGHQDVVEYLVQHGADVNLQGGKFGTAIAAAASRHHQGIVEYLLQHGAVLNLQGGN